MTTQSHTDEPEVLTPFEKIGNPVLIAEQGEGAILISDAATAEKIAILQDIRNLQRRIWEAENGFGLNLTKCGNARAFLDHAKEQIEQC